jgi:3-phosphoshikimate 1-carboxyvinyltransferase
MMRTVRFASALSGTVDLPGDKSISHRYAMLAALAEGESELCHFASSRDCHSTLDCLRRLGVSCRVAGDSVTVTGAGLRGLQAPRDTLDAGNSGTTIRLLSGILAGYPFESRITGDDSLRSRPMGRIIDPLRRMGASIEGRRGNLPPLGIRGGLLKGLRYSLPVASAQVKSCVLLAGLFADRVTGVEEPVPTRDHTEIALAHFGASVRCGDWIEVEPGPRLRGAQLEVPGDLSGAAFFLIASAIVPGAQLLIRRVGLNTRRRELLTYLQTAGLDVQIENERSSAGEPRGDLNVRYSDDLLSRPLPPVDGRRAVALIDEIPVLAVLGACAGGLEVSGAGELRVKESDRISAIAENLRAMGATVEEKPDGFAVRGRSLLRGADIETRSDHRIAMAFAVAGLAAGGETRIHDADCAAISFPGFFDLLESLCTSH